MAVHVQFDVYHGNKFGDLARHFNLLHVLCCPCDALAQRLLCRRVIGQKCLRVCLVAFAPLDDLDTVVDVLDGGNIDAEAEAVGQLRAQFALLRVHGADQQEARRVAERNAFALNDIDAHRGSIKQHIDHIIVQQVDLINVEDAAISLCQHARLEASLSLAQRVFDIQRSYHAIFRGVDGQIDHAHTPAHDGQRLAPLFAFAAGCAHLLWPIWRAGKGAIGHRLNLRQHSGQRPHSSRLGRAFLSTNQHAANRGRNGIEDQRQFHLILAHNCTERINRCHWYSRFSPPPQDNPPPQGGPRRRITPRRRVPARGTPTIYAPFPIPHVIARSRSERAVYSRATPCGWPVPRGGLYRAVTVTGDGLWWAVACNGRWPVTGGGLYRAVACNARVVSYSNSITP